MVINTYHFILEIIFSKEIAGCGDDWWKRMMMMIGEEGDEGWKKK
jgi:hypothetical protein